MGVYEKGMSMNNNSFQNTCRIFVMCTIHMTYFLNNI